MKKIKKSILTALALIMAIVIVQSCKKNSAAPNYNSNKSVLNQQIDSATALYSIAVEGVQAGDYSPGSKAVLETAITLAKGVSSGSFTQQQVNNALGNLQRAEATFKVDQVQEVSPANLVAFWKFDGDPSDATGHGHDGVLKTNYVGSSAATAVDGNTLPVLTTDRYGNPNSAYYFNNGAYIEIPYSDSLYKPNFSLVVWVNPQVASAGNYIFSEDHYEGYKFQLQSGNLPFLTVATSNGIHDEDDGGTAVTTGKWSQIAVTFSAGTFVFYVNGLPVRTVVPGGNLIAPQVVMNFCIANEFPKSVISLTDNSSPTYFYGANFFQGSLDQMRYYNKVLSDSEVHSLFIQESPQ